ncbi:helix-turn-helix transcriptional regulator [Pengzhenrongella frigida]|uniref:WYL domain-containing protein n=1 Tax=Pengzhenrongella frigida TaxID=1259133 RepID=A0A4Q5N517_9MICO|nr:WYL domain-containing protein [Cellulomonas sp. HLT2-17]RYV51141.1 WYL domain-containing protein [Cellulomonas sp. HLT2-17]
MNRTDRLYAITEELRRAARAGRTSGQLAAALEVSDRTIKRDVSALQQAGSPIWAQPGPGGGYVLDASASLPPVNFSPSQAVAVAVALAALPPGSPFAVDGAAARGKVFDALGPGDRERARDVAGRIWFETPTGAHPRAERRVLRVVEQALLLHLVLAIGYRDSAGRGTHRAVEPVLLARRDGRWFLVAWCRDRAAIRWFRLDRIGQADLMREHYPPRDVAEVGTPPADAAPVLAPTDDGPTLTPDRLRRGGPTERSC